MTEPTVTVTLTAREARAVHHACTFVRTVFDGVCESPDFVVPGVHPLDSAAMLLEVAMVSERVER